MQQVVIKYVAKMIITDKEAEKIKKATAANSEFEKTIKSMIDGELFEDDRKYTSKVVWEIKE